jgi:integrase
VAGKWVKPGATTKQKTEHEVALSNAALILLKDMRKSAPEEAVYLFPSHGKSGHLTEVKKAWAAITKAARIAGLRAHDLRHSFASVLVSKGLSLPTIGALLGHAQVSTTARYSHLFDEALRDAANRAGSAMAGLVLKPGKGGKFKAVAGGKR